MGQAKQRGSYEERKAAALAKQQQTGISREMEKRRRTIPDVLLMLELMVQRDRGKVIHLNPIKPLDKPVIPLPTLDEEDT